MSRQPIDEYLARIPLFSELSKQQLRDLSSLATPLDVKAGRVLMKEGEPGRELVVIVEGTADVQRGGKSINSQGPGNFVGEIALLLDRPRTATVVAETDLSIEVIERHAFEAFLKESPQLYEPLLKAAVSRLAVLEESAS